MKVILNRDVTTEECHWLEEDISKGTVMYVYNGYTYGCIQPSGTACTMVDGETPFMEIPNDAISRVLTEEDKLAEDKSMADSQTAEQPFIEITKIDSATGEPHKNGIEKGYVNRGIMVSRPSIGNNFLVSGIGGYFRTSRVVEILTDDIKSGTFKTGNSVYQWKVLVEAN